MSRSPAAILYDASGNPLALAEGSSIPEAAPGLLLLGNEGGLARPLSLANGAISVDAESYLYRIAEGKVADHTLWQGHTRATLGTNARTLVTEGIWAWQTSGARRSIKSASASDSASGTGARKLLLVYISAVDGTEKHEVVTLNGTTAVNTVATDIKHVNGLVVIDAGSGGVPVGLISLYSTTGGGGTVIAQLIAGNTTTHSATYWVPSDKTLFVVSLNLYNYCEAMFDLERTVDYSALGGGTAVVDMFLHFFLATKHGGSQAEQVFPAPYIVGPGQRFSFFALQASGVTICASATGWLE